ncbi:oligosaccharide flippase family protein [uncultured Cyclobacterium sp.]|uniref:oligosaccharide flippase family protein n=1 Tax=uncultured Cyclobacterium sp. TaxID=453820 RepID=UPI0030EB1CE7|tara:strand:+ start:25496 stop:26986 length:1491 start_codon:yes stop_codon:yes gene_type:complete
MAGVKQSVLTTIFSYLGVLVGYVNLLWLFPYVLSPSQIGLFKTVQDIALLLVPFAQLGIGHGITRYFPRLRGNEFAFFSFSLVIATIGFIMVASMFFVFKNPIINAFAEKAPEVINYLVVALLITFFSLINSLLEAFCRSFLKVAIPSLIRDVFLRVFMAMLIIGYSLSIYSFDNMIWGLGVVYILAMISIVIYMKRERIFKFDFNWEGITRPFKKEYLRYSLITLLGTAGALLIMKIDSIMVSSMIGLDANAIYTIGFSIAVVIEMPRRAISQVAMPVISEKFAKNQLAGINALYKKIAINQLLICLLIFLMIWINIENLYHFVPNRAIYEQGKWVVLLIGLGKLTDVIFSVNGEIIVFSKFYTFNITATLLMSAAVIIFNLALIPLYGIEGAALASLIAMFFYNLVKFIYIKIRLGFNPFTPGVFFILIAGGLSWAVSYYLIPTFEAVIPDILIRSGIVTAVYLSLVHLFKAATETEALVIQKVKGVLSIIVNR